MERDKNLKDNSDNKSLDQDLELGHIFSYAVKENFISETKSNQLREKIMKSLGLRDHIQKMIDKCTIELGQIYDNGNIKVKPKQMPNDIWSDIQEDRADYLSELRSKLQFMLDYPEREQVV